MIAFRKNLSLWIVLLVAFIDYMGIGLVYPMFASMLFDKTTSFLPVEASDTMRGLCLGVLLCLMPVAQFFSAPVLGSLSDQQGRKRILVWSLFLAVLGYLIAVIGVITQSIIALFVSRLFIGIASGSAAVVQAALADLSTENEKMKNFGLYNMAMGTGFTIGPLLGGVLSHTKWGYVTPFWFSVAVLSLNLFLVLAYFKELPLNRIPRAVSWISGFLNIRKAAHMQGIRVLFLCMFIFSFGWSFFMEFIPVFLIGHFSFTPMQIGNFYAFSGGMYALSCGILIRPLLQHFPSRHILFYALMLAGSYILVFLSIDNANSIWLYLPFLLYLIALVYPTATAMISNWAGKKEQGEILGIFQSIQSVAFAVSPIFSGSLVGFYYFMPIIVGGSSMLVAGIIFGSFLWLSFLKDTKFLVPQEISQKNEESETAEEGLEEKEP